VIQIVSGDGKVGAMLASHMGINKISFTGSLIAGKKVQEMAAKRLVPHTHACPAANFRRAT
jgi:aldehyde dehydrogenase (NAD+)